MQQFILDVNDVALSNKINQVVKSEENDKLTKEKTLGSEYRR